MGHYTNNLFKKNRTKSHRTTMAYIDTNEEALVTGSPQPYTERLVSVAIQRGGVVYKEFRSHSELRRALGDEYPYEHTVGDIEGFWTNENRFLERNEANRVGAAAG